MKYHLNYQLFPYGTVLNHEGQSNQKLNVIIKGKAIKFQPKPQSKIQAEGIKSLFSIEEFQEDSQTEKENVIDLLQKKTKSVAKIPSALDKFKRCVQIAGRIKTLHEQIKTPSPKKLLLKKLSSMLEDLPSDDQQPEESSPGPRIMPINNDKARRKFARTKTLNSLTSISQDESPKKVQKSEAELANINNILSTLILELQEVEKESEQKEEEKDESPRKAQMRKLKENAALEAEMKLLEHVRKNEPGFGQRYFSGEICKVERQKEYHPGNYFGEHFLKVNKPKENLLIVAEDLHVLTVTRDSVAEVVTFLYEKSVQKAKYFIGMFPTMKEETIKSFSYLFREKMIHKDEKIYTEGETPSSFCLLRSGSVKLMKKIEIGLKEKLVNSDSLLLNAHKSQKIEFPVSSIVEGHFFGEELILETMKRQFTTLAITSGTVVYFLEKSDFLANKGHFTEIFQKLISQAKEKSYWRYLRLEGLIGRMKEQSPKPITKSQNDGFSGKLAELGVVSQKKGTITGLDISSPRTKQVTSPRKYVEVNKEKEISKNLSIYKEKFSRKVQMERINEALKKQFISERNVLNEPFFDQENKGSYSKRYNKKQVYHSSKNLHEFNKGVGKYG